MLLCEMLLLLRWEWMHRWHPAYPAAVSELECFTWDRTWVARFPKTESSHLATWVVRQLQWDVVSRLTKQFISKGCDSSC